MRHHTATPAGDQYAPGGALPHTGMDIGLVLALGVLVVLVGLGLHRLAGNPTPGGRG